MHSLSGVVPVGAFMLLQLWAHAKALEGQAAHRAALALALPTSWLAWLLVGVPLAFHAGYGLVLTARPRYNVGRYPLSRNWTYTLQRVTGLMAMAFIAMTAYFGWSARARPDELPTRLIATLSSTTNGFPLVAFACLMGVGACTLHFATGLWTLGVRYGWLGSRDAEARWGALFVLVGLALFGWGGHTVLFLATGWRAVGSEPRPEAGLCESGVAELGAASSAPSRPRAPETRPSPSAAHAPSAAPGAAPEVEE